MEQKEKKIRLGFWEIKSCSCFSWVIIPTLACPLKDAWNTAGKRSQLDRGGLTSTRVCGCHCGILLSPGQFGESYLHPAESEIPRRAAAEPCACCQLDRSPLMGWGRAGSVVGHMGSLQGGTKICLLCAVFTVESLRKVTGLDLGAVGSSGHHLAEADHLNHALCTFLVSSMETRWEKHLWKVSALVCHCTLPICNGVWMCHRQKDTIKSGGFLRILCLVGFLFVWFCWFFLNMGDKLTGV